MARKFVTFAAASSGQPVTRAAAPAKPSTPTPVAAAAHEPTVPSPTLNSLAAALKDSRVKRGGQ